MFKFENARNFSRREMPAQYEFPAVLNAESRQLESKFRLVEDRLGYQELFLPTQTGEELRLNDYLPEGVEFKGGPDKKFSCGTQSLEHPDGESVVTHEVSFNSEVIDSVEGRLGLFHEIGHGIDFAENNGNDSAESIFILGRIRKDIINSPEFGWMDESEEKEQYFLKKFKEKWRTAATEYAKEEGLEFPYKDLIDALKDFVRSERDAWSNGLTLYRKIKSEREIDVLEGANVSEVFASVDRALATYERAYGSIIDDYNSMGPIRRFIEMCL